MSNPDQKSLAAFSSFRRRSFLQIVGGGVLLAASPARAGPLDFLGGFFDEVPAAANAPWREAGQFQDVRKKILSYALLAPNPHNLQPWSIDLKTPGQATLLLNDRQLLPHTDPHSRQILIGLGCFSELAVIAGTMFKTRVQVTPFPEGAWPANDVDTKRPVARLDFSKADLKPDALAASIVLRRSVKEPFDLDRALPRASLEALNRLGKEGQRTHATTAKTMMPDVRRLLRDAMRLEQKTPRTFQESIDVMRIGSAEIVKNPDGISLGGPFLESLRMFGLLSRKSLADPSSTSFQTSIDRFDAMAAGTPGVFWLCTNGNSRLDQFRAGRTYLRAALTTTSLGLSLHPMSQALQEYPEMKPLYRKIHERLRAPAGHRLQMVCRLGVGPKVAPAPRWALANKLHA